MSPSAYDSVLIDSHLDLGLAGLVVRRDLLAEVDAIREREGCVVTRLPNGEFRYERGLGEEPGTCTTSLPELRRARCAVALVTFLARCRPWVKPSRQRGGGIDYPTPQQAEAHAMAELSLYRRLERMGEAMILTTAADLDRTVERYQRDPEQAPLGLIFTMEGADPIVEPSDLAAWHERGLRGLSLAHYGHSRYAGGTPDPKYFPNSTISTVPPPSDAGDGPDPHASDIPLTDLGRALFDEINRLNANGQALALDLTHTCDRSFTEALERVEAPVYLSHSNARAITGSIRENTDTQFRSVIDRGGVIGVVLHSGMIHPRGKTLQADGNPPLTGLIDHIDHICDVAGNAHHVGIGSDLDGGFGAEHTPVDLDRYSDLRKLTDMLSARGYTDEQIDGLFYGNWLRFWRGVLT
ncbi:MAG: membrane dipeptidase [Planctomycetota bacterium]